jgi:hypothetical protein
MHLVHETLVVDLREGEEAVIEVEIPLHDRYELLPIFFHMKIELARAGGDPGVLEIALQGKDFLRVLYELGDPGISSGRTLSWNGTTGGAMPKTVEASIPGGKIVFRMASEKATVEIEEP